MFLFYSKLNKNHKIATDINLLNEFTQQGENLFNDQVIVHLTSHAVNKHCLFKSRFDESIFIATAFYYAKKYNVEILSIVLLDNHYHLLAKAKWEEQISNFWQQTNSSYACFFNARYDRKGSLFENVNNQSKKIIRSIKHLIRLLRSYFPKNFKQAKKRTTFISIDNPNNNNNTYLMFCSIKLEKKLENLLKNTSINEGYRIRIAYLLNFIKKYLVPLKFHLKIKQYKNPNVLQELATILNN